MRSRTWKLVRLVAPLGLIPLFACLVAAGRVAEDHGHARDERARRAVGQEQGRPLVHGRQLDLDGAEAEGAADRFPQLIKRSTTSPTQGNPASYHIGVVTSDLGAGQTRSRRSAIRAATAPSCRSRRAPTRRPAAGELHELRARRRHPLSSTTTRSPAPTTSCRRPQTSPTAFTCMASVGDQGCGFEHQLESAYRALHDNRSPRTRASCAPTRSSPSSSSPTKMTARRRTTPISFDPATSRRQHVRRAALVPLHAVRHPVQRHAGDRPVDLGPDRLHVVRRCRTAASCPTSDTYINFFTKPAAQGGVKVDPNDVILVGISAPTDPVGVTDHDAVRGPADTAVVPDAQPLVRRGDEHRCSSAIRPFASTLSSTSAKHNSLTSICDTDYTAAIQSLGDLIISQIGAGCLNSPIANRADGTPDCVVTDVTATAGRLADVDRGSVVRRERPRRAVLAGRSTSWRSTTRAVLPAPLPRRASCRRRASPSPPPWRQPAAAAERRAGRRRRLRARDRLDRSRHRLDRQAERGAGGHDRAGLLRDHRQLDVVVAFARYFVVTSRQPRCRPSPLSGGRRLLSSARRLLCVGACASHRCRCSAAAGRKRQPRRRRTARRTVARARQAGESVIRRAPNKVDLLFVLDDAPTMGSSSARWRAALPALVDALAATRAPGRRSRTTSASSRATSAPGRSRSARSAVIPAATAGAARHRRLTRRRALHRRQPVRRHQQRSGDVAARSPRSATSAPPAANFRSRSKRPIARSTTAAPENAGFLRIGRAARRRLRHRRRRLLGAGHICSIGSDVYGRSIASLHAIRHRLQRQPRAADGGSGLTRLRVADDGEAAASSSTSSSTSGFFARARRARRREGRPAATSSSPASPARAIRVGVPSRARAPPTRHARRARRSSRSCAAERRALLRRSRGAPGDRRQRATNDASPRSAPRDTAIVQGLLPTIAATAIGRCA